MQTWMITGASRGLGLEMTRQALGRGDAVIAVARRPESVQDALARSAPDDRLLCAGADVTDPRTVDDAVAAGLARFGGIDVLVNNAGRGIVGAIEEVSDDEARSIFDTNVFGVLNVTRAVLPAMRDQASGHVIMMSSMGGFAQPGTGWGIYGASKFALEGLSEALRNELAPLGVAVTLVEPGVFRTDFLDTTSLQHAALRIQDYDQTSGRTRDHATRGNHQQQGDPRKAAAAIMSIAGRPGAPMRLPLGVDALTAIQDKLDAVASDLDATRDLAESTALDSP